MRWLYLFYIVIASALGGLIFGFDSGVISGCEKVIQDQYQLTPFNHGLTVSIALIGTVIGAFSIGRPCDLLGRRRSLFLMALLFFISAVGCAFAPNWHTLVVMRFIGGLAIGGVSVIVPLYIVEIAPGHLRGRLVAVNQLNIVLGILTSYVSNYLVAKAIDNQSIVWEWCTKLANFFVTTPMGADEIKWRLMLGAECLPIIIFWALLFTIPESPRWLVRKNRKEEARTVLEKIGDEDCDKTLDEISNSLAMIQSQGQDNVRLFQKKYLWVIFLAWAVAMFNQLSGINALIYYTPRIFEMCNLGSESALLATVGVGTVNLIFTVIALFFIDWFGRRALLMFGALGTTAMYVLITWQLYLPTDQINSTVCVLGFFGFIAFFAISQGAVIWVFISEIFPNAVRAKGQALGSFTHWFMCVVVSWTFPIVVNYAVWPAFAFFGCMTLLQFFFALYLMPETKGGTIEQMEKELVGSSEGSN